MFEKHYTKGVGNLKIIEVNHRFRYSLVQRTTTKRIIIHHAASTGDVSAATIHQWHLNNGWSGIGYHYVIRTGGNIERGRPENTVGAHAGAGSNSNSIGICLAGNLSVQDITEAQIKSLVLLINDIRNRLGDLEVIGHKDVMSTECPGKKFPWSRLWQLLKNEEAVEDGQVKLTVNGRPTKAQLRIVNDRTQVLVSRAWIEVRELASLLMAGIDWNPGTRTVNLVIK